VSESTILRKMFLQEGRLAQVSEATAPSDAAKSKLPLTSFMDTIPACHSLDLSIFTPISAQYRLLSHACMHVVLHELCLLRVCCQIQAILLARDARVLHTVIAAVNAALEQSQGILSASALNEALQTALVAMPDDFSCRCAHSNSLRPFCCSWCLPPWMHLSLKALELAFQSILVFVLIERISV
jgi:hypothetical protein